MKNKILFTNSARELYFITVFKYSSCLFKKLVLPFVLTVFSIGHFYCQECKFENIDDTPLSNFIFPISGSRCSDECVNSCDFPQSIIIPVAFHIIPDPSESQLYPNLNIVNFNLAEANAILGPNITLVDAKEYYPCVNFYNSPSDEYLTITPSNESQIFQTSRYDPRKVLNIYYVRWIDAIGSSIKGYSWTPQNNSWSWNNDGIVLNKVASGETLAHEIGHYLSLLHIWGNNEFDDSNCHSTSENCTHGDLVSDTPPCRGEFPFSITTCVVNSSLWNEVFNGSPINPFCGPDMTYMCTNIMGYGTGRTLITPNQYNRMIYSYHTFRSEMNPSSFNVNVTNIGPTSAKIYWTSTVNSTGYEIRYRKVDDASYTTITVNNATFQFLLNNLSIGTSYVVQVRPLCTQSFKTVEFKTLCPQELLCEPCNLQADKTISLSGLFTALQVKGTIFIKNNSTVTINSTVKFASNSKIVIEKGSKLILDGAILTKCSSANNWIGIEVFGDANSSLIGTVEMKNNAEIEHALIGINASPQFPGGLVTITNGIIRNCDIGIKFGSKGKWFGASDQSTVSGCQFINCDIGVVTSRNRGVQYSNCIFDNNTGVRSHAGILSENSSFNITLSTFNNQEYGIYFDNLYPTISSFDATKCTFTDCHHGILNGSLGNLLKGNIAACDFIGIDNSGIASLGMSDIDIRRNTFLGNGFYNDLGAITSHFTEDASLILDNQFTQNSFGHIADGDNNLIYLTNCHSYNSNSDMDVAGTVYPIQENPINLQFAPSNSFSKVNGTNSITTNQDFEYVIASGTLNSSVKFPSGVGFTRVFEGTDLLTECGSGLALPPYITTYNYWYCPPVSTFNVYQTIQDLKAQKQAIQNNPNLSARLKKILIARIDLCMKKLKSQYVTDIRNDSDGKQKTLDFLKSDDNFAQRANAYGIMVEEGHYSSARLYLSLINPGNQGEIDFVNIQNKALDILEGLRTISSFTSTELANIESIGISRNPYAGYARALYHHLTGSKLFPTIQYASQPTPRTKMNVENDIKCYPNPVSNDLYYIELPFSQAQNQYEVKLHDMTGNIVKQSTIKNSKNELDLSSMMPGVYMITISDSDHNTVYTQKLVKI